MPWKPLRSKDHDKPEVVSAFKRDVPNCSRVTNVQRWTAVPGTVFRGHCLQTHVSGKFVSLGYWVYNAVSGTVKKEE